MYQIFQCEFRLFSILATEIWLRVDFGKHSSKIYSDGILNSVVSSGMLSLV